jgi:integrase/recombinase XerC
VPGRAFKRAGQDAQPVPGALVHGLRHTTPRADVSVYPLMKLLGHESMTTSQRYVAAAGTETRNAAAKNPLYAVLDSAKDHRRVLTIISMLLANC